jgi:hypothetical protein
VRFPHGENARLSATPPPVFGGVGWRALDGSTNASRLSSSPDACAPVVDWIARKLWQADQSLLRLDAIGLEFTILDHSNSTADTNAND